MLAPDVGCLDNQKVFETQKMKAGEPGRLGTVDRGPPSLAGSQQQ
jgi:hypothetical protein